MVGGDGEFRGGVLGEPELAAGEDGFVGLWLGVSLGVVGDEDVGSDDLGRFGFALRDGEDDVLAAGGSIAVVFAEPVDDVRSSVKPAAVSLGVLSRRTKLAVTPQMSSTARTTAATGRLRTHNGVVVFECRPMRVDPSRVAYGNAVRFVIYWVGIQRAARDVRLRL